MSDNTVDPEVWAKEQGIELVRIAPAVVETVGIGRVDEDIIYMELILTSPGENNPTKGVVLPLFLSINQADALGLKYPEYLPTETTNNPNEDN